jgi:hypothetical protein
VVNDVPDGGGGGAGLDPLDAAFLKAVADRTAGDPMDAALVFKSLDLVQRLMETTSTATGLSVAVPKIESKTALESR